MEPSPFGTSSGFLGDQDSRELDAYLAADLRADRQDDSPDQAVGNASSLLARRCHQLKPLQAGHGGGPRALGIGGNTEATPRQQCRSAKIPTFELYGR